MRILGFALVVLAACHPPGWGKDQGEVDAAAAVDAAPAPDAGPTAPDATPITCDQTFRLEGQAAATSVLLTGDFTSWAGQPADGAIPLTLDVDSAWTVVHTFAAGTYQYKFIVDGAWIPDPANPDTVDDTFGGVNSLYVCD